MASIIYFGPNNIETNLVIEKLLQARYIEYSKTLQCPQTPEQKWNKDLVNYIISLSSNNLKSSIVFRDLNNLWKLNIHDKLLKTLEEDTKTNFIFIAKNHSKIPATIKSRSIIFQEKLTNIDNKIEDTDLFNSFNNNLNDYSFQKLNVITKIFEKHNTNLKYNLPVLDNIEVPMDLINER